MKRAHTVAIATALYLVSQTPAYSQDLGGFVQNLMGKYAVSWSDLDSRRADLAAEVEAAAKAGQITPAQAGDFRTELTKIANDITAAKASGRRLGVTQSIAFSNQINVVATSLSTAVQNTAQHTVPTSLPDVDKLQAELTTQIDTVLKDGQISAQTAADLKAELAQVATMEAAYKVDSGANLTPRQIELLTARLNTVKGKLEQQTRIGQSAIPALNDRRTSVENKITQGLAAGRITTAEATTWRTELSAIATAQQTYQTAGNGILTGSQVLQIAQRLDVVDDQVSAKIVGLGTTPGGVGLVSTADLDADRDQIGSRINRWVSSGRMSNAEAAQYLHDLDRIAELERLYKNAPGGITVSHVQKLQGDLADVRTKMETWIASARAGGGFGGPGKGGGFGGGGRFGGGGGRRGGGGRFGGGAGGGADVGAGGDINTNIGNAGNVGTVGGGTTAKINLPVIAQKNFPDVTGYWGEPYVLELASRNVIGGFPNGTFGPNSEITREQFAAIVVKALNLPMTSGGKVFTDVPASRWSSASIAAAANAGLIGGFPDGTFKPADNITRAQALVILSKALGSTPAAANMLSHYTDSAAVPSWASQAVSTAADAKIIVNFPDATQIRPNATATRGEVAALMYQTLNAMGANLPPLRIGVLGSNM